MEQVKQAQSLFSPMNCLASIFITIVLLAFFYPVYGAHWFDNQRAFEYVLSFHQRPGSSYRHAPCILYFSWFPEGRPTYARGFGVYQDGTYRAQRIYWNHGTGGGGSKMKDQTAFAALKNLPPLPQGLSDPKAVAVSRLLTVSQDLQGRWTTRYYDRKHLPEPVQDILRLTDVNLKTGRTNANSL